MVTCFAYIDPSQIVTVGGGIAGLLAMIGSGFGFFWVGFKCFGSWMKTHKVVSFLAFCVLCGTGVWAYKMSNSAITSNSGNRIVLLGLDGLCPRIIDRMMAEGKLPNFKKLAERGSYSRLKTTNPPQSPVAWASFATGLKPGRHGLTDFIRRNPETLLPDLALTRYDGKKAETVRKGKPFWAYCKEHNIPTVILRCPVTFPPEEVNGRMLSGMGTPDLLGTQGRFCVFTNTMTDVSESRGEVIIIGSQAEQKLKLPGPNRKTFSGKVEQITVLFNPDFLTFCLKIWNPCLLFHLS